MWYRTALFATLLLAFSPPSRGQAPAPLSLDDALRRAAELSPALARARGALEAARAYETRARRRFEDNPEIELIGGCCRDDDALDFEATLAQSLDGALRRAARRGSASADVARAAADLDAARREVSSATTRAFFQALAGQERLALLEHDRRLVEDLGTMTERLAAAGELAALATNRASTTRAAARSAARAAMAEHRQALATLGALVGLAPPFALAGDLTIGEPTTPAPPLEQRSDLRRLAAELAAAEAEVALGRSLARPAWGLRAGFEREEHEDVFRAGLALTLPLAERGREVRAAGGSRAESLRRALVASRAAAEAEVAGARAVLADRLAALAEIETVLPTLADSEHLALRSFETGEIGLGELLLARREILETRLAHLDRRLEAALAHLDLQTAEGRLP